MVTEIRLQLRPVLAEARHVGGAIVLPFARGATLQIEVYSMDLVGLNCS
jgi:hypothetical protein